MLERSGPEWDRRTRVQSYRRISVTEAVRPSGLSDNLDSVGEPYPEGDFRQLAVTVTATVGLNREIMRVRLRRRVLSMYPDW
jgi:hypothetical protein